MTSPLFSLFSDPGRQGAAPEGKFTACWQSPSNIALVKYWGKRDDQMPVNPSLSMTLEKAVSLTLLEAKAGEAKKGLVEVNGDPQHPFIPKMQQLIGKLFPGIPSLGNFSFRATTSNTFPHSTGIASSASGLSAFTLCLLDIACQSMNLEIPLPEWKQVASFASRLGSGSACRSIYGGFAVWGRSAAVPGSCDEYAVPVTNNVHASFLSLCDAILIVSSAKKEVSSSLGHRSMARHPYLDGRILQANENLQEALSALAGNDFEKLGYVAECEAMSLHALLMSAKPWIVLMQPATLGIIRHVVEARKNGMPIFFTLDAGANVHILYPRDCSAEVENYIESVLSPFCEGGRVILDGCGKGPVMLPANREKAP